MGENQPHRPTTKSLHMASNGARIARRAMRDMNGIGLWGIATIVAITISPVGVLAAEYPCPADPGFCYRDVADDGCFDAGPDVGPINADIESSSSFPAVPPPGSLVCPPSVKRLTATATDIRLATAAGSSVLFYAAKIDGVDDFAIVSGGDILLGETVRGRRDAVLEASGDVVVEKGVDLKQAIVDGIVSMSATGGNVTIGPKARFRAAGIFAEAISGNVELLEKVKITARFLPTTPADVFLEASGDVTMNNATFVITGSSVRFKAEGANVFVVGKSKIKMKGEFSPTSADITATRGDVVVDSLIMRTDAPIAVSGANVTIGVEDDGKTRKSKITQVREIGGSVDILATGAIDLTNVALVSAAEVLIDTSGTTVNVRDSVLKGKKASPTFTVSAGAGSTCDLTGATVQSATLATNCDTVVP